MTLIETLKKSTANSKDLYKCRQSIKAFKIQITDESTEKKKEEKKVYVFT